MAWGLTIDIIAGEGLLWIVGVGEASRREASRGENRAIWQYLHLAPASK